MTRFAYAVDPRAILTPALARVHGRGRETQTATSVPYFAGLMSGETDALVRSFAGEPELRHPVGNSKTWQAACRINSFVFPRQF